MEQLKPNVLLWDCSKNYKHATKTFSEEEIKQMLDALENNGLHYWKEGGYSEWGSFYKARDVCLVAFIYYHALRPKEACYLKLLDIDFQKRTIYIAPWSNKTNKDRVVRLSKLVMPYLEKYLAFNKKFWKGSDYAFPSFQNSHISPQTLKTIMREKVLKPLGLYEKVDNTPKHSRTSLYSLRHSRATHLLNQTKDIFLVANTLGHKDIRTTANYYLHESEEYNKYMQAAIDGEAEASKVPDIQINQTNNFNFMQIIQTQNQQIIQLTKVIENLSHGMAVKA